jgi:hypothetical protein
VTQQEPEESEEQGIRENQILSESATVEQCRSDFRAGSTDRATAFKQWRRTGGA